MPRTSGLAAKSRESVRFGKCKIKILDKVAEAATEAAAERAAEAAEMHSTITEMEMETFLFHRSPLSKYIFALSTLPPVLNTRSMSVSLSPSQYLPSCFPWARK